MDPRLPPDWQSHPQDAQASKQLYRPTPQINYATIQLGPSLLQTVTSNEKVPAFVPFRALNRIQRILADGSFQQYLFCTNGEIVKAELEQFHCDSVTLINEQHCALQRDLPILVAFDREILDFELKINSHSTAASSTNGLSSQFASPTKLHYLNNSVLHMMRSRAALLRQDVKIRADLERIESTISKYAAQIIPFVLRIKYYLMLGQYNEDLVKDDFWQAMKILTPWNVFRDQKRAELQTVRDCRAALEKTLAEAKSRLQGLHEAGVERREEL